MNFVIECLLMLGLITSPNNVDLSKFTNKQVKAFKHFHHTITQLEERNKNFEFEIEKILIDSSKKKVKVWIVYDGGKKRIVIFDELEV